MRKKSTGLVRRGPNPPVFSVIPAHKKRVNGRRRRSNPAAKGLIIEGLYSGAGAIATELIVSFIPWQLAWYIRAGLKVGTGVALSALAEKFSFTRPHATSIGLGGVAVGGADIIRNLVPRLVSQVQGVVAELVPVQVLTGAPAPAGAISAAQVLNAAQNGNPVAQTAIANAGGVNGLSDIVFLPSARGVNLNATPGLGDIVYFPMGKAA